MPVVCIHIPVEVLEQQGQFFGFCDTLKTFGIRSKDEFEMIDKNFNFYFLLFKSGGVEQLERT